MTEKNNDSELQVNKIRRAGLNQGSAFLNEAYLDFVSKKDNSISRVIKLQLFKKIMKDLYLEFAMCVLDGKEIALPCRMGNILVNKRASDKRRVIDFKATKDQGKTVSEYNSHTDGYRFSIQWRKADPIFGVQKGYQFKASRILTRDLAKKLKDGNGYKYQSLSNKKVDKYEI